MLPLQLPATGMVADLTETSPKKTWRGTRKRKAPESRAGWRLKSALNEGLAVGAPSGGIVRTDGDRERVGGCIDRDDSLGARAVVRHDVVAFCIGDVDLIVIDRAVPCGGRSPGDGEAGTDPPIVDSDGNTGQNARNTG